MRATVTIETALEGRSSIKKIYGRNALSLVHYHFIHSRKSYSIELIFDDRFVICGMYGFLKFDKPQAPILRMSLETLCKIPRTPRRKPPFRW